MDKIIAVLKGDGIGPEIVDSAIAVLQMIERRFNIKFDYRFGLIGGVAIDATGAPLPSDTLELCKNADAVLLGAVGGPKWDGLAAHLRPEKALLSLRQSLGLFANLRPAVLYDSLKSSSPLRADIVKNGIDLIVVRELTGGIYFGPRGFRDGPLGQEAFDTEVYSIAEVEQIAKVAFEIAMGRRKKLTSVDKANVLDSGKLWRATVDKIAKSYPDVTVEHILVDNCAMQIVKDPSQFDVMLMPNMFGDILSDEAAMVTGSIGLLPSASLGAGKKGLYEPIHGSAPTIAGQDIANPIATILSCGMLLATSFDMIAPANAIEKAVSETLKKGFRTPDIFNGSAGTRRVGTKKITEEIAIRI